MASRYLPDGRYGVSGGRDGTVKLWDIETGELVQGLEGHDSTVNDVAVTPDGRHAISASYDRTIRIREIEVPMK